MLVPTQTDIESRLYRYDGLVADAARSRLVTAVRQPVLPATPGPTGRARAGLRQAVA